MQQVIKQNASNTSQPIRFGTQWVPQYPSQSDQTIHQTKTNTIPHQPLECLSIVYYYKSVKKGERT